jgi:hypothetical protein
MPITFACPCGKSFTVADALAGKRTRCPACKSLLTVPEPEIIEDFEVIEEDLEAVADDAPAPYGLADDRPPVPAAPAADPEPEIVDDEPVIDDGKPDYFTVAYDGSNSLVHKSKFFRVYPDGDELLFVHSGPFNWSALDIAVGRDAIKAMAVRNSVMYGAEVGIGLGLVAAGLMALTNAQERKEIARRAAVLDPMTIEQLRAEVDQDKASFRVHVDNTADVKIEPPKTGLFANKNVEPNIIGRLRFTHDPTGKWALLIVSKPDARACIRSFRKVFGRGGVDVELRIKKDRPEAS